jgi:hypothetical protein
MDNAPSDDQKRKHVFGHAMWRTGSTALARCFLDSEDYLVFYEPFHRSCGNILKPKQAKRPPKKGGANLRHPEWKGGYFDTYKLIDPKTGQPLSELYNVNSAIPDVYNGVSDGTHDYIAACLRVAESQGKAAFLGFCRSGLQQKDLLMGGDATAFYLSRDPVSQFLSYSFPANSYFLANTLRQLRYSTFLRVTLLSVLTRRAVKLALPLIESPILTERGKTDLANRLCTYLTNDDRYALFFLSHAATQQMARALGTSEFSVNQLADTPGARQTFEDQFGVSLSALRNNARTVSASEQKRYANIEARVLDALSIVDFKRLAKCNEASS